MQTLSRKLGVPVSLLKYDIEFLFVLFACYLFRGSNLLWLFNELREFNLLTGLHAGHSLTRRIN